MRLALTACLILVAQPALAAIPVTGRWLTQEKDSIVEIAPCGKSLCGRVIRILKPTPDGKAATDRYNPDVALRNRPVLGLNILSGFTDGGSGWNGRIYDPTSGKSYRSILARNPDGSLKVKGCIMMFCQSQRWTPVK